MFGSDRSFFDILEQQALAAHRAAVVFRSLTDDFTQLQACADEIDRIENEADELTHRLASKSDKTFITPLDKEDLRALSSALDDITDAIEAAVGRMLLYRLHTPRPDVAPMLDLLVQITADTQKVVSLLATIREREKIHSLLVQIHKIENQSDSLFRQGLQDLFDTPNPDPLMVIKWKEIYDRIEIAVDKCEDVANAVESVVVKYA